MCQTSEQLKCNCDLTYSLVIIETFVELRTKAVIVLTIAAMNSLMFGLFYHYVHCNNQFLKIFLFRYLAHETAARDL